MLLYKKVKGRIYRKLYLLYTPINKIAFYLNGITYGNGLKVTGRVCIRNIEGQVFIGNNVRINSASWANPIGLGDRTYFQIFDGGKIVIGNGSGISNTAITCAEKITIGNNVLLGAGCKIFDTDFHPIETKYRLSEVQEKSKIQTCPVEICDGAFIGGGAYILKGVTIGFNSIVGAGSVVAKSIPPNEVWAGNPARFIKSL